jgi:hypothetical protein
MNKAREWLPRYWLAEVIGLATALLSVLLTRQLGGSMLAAAVIAPWGENIGYYGTMLVRELRSESRQQQRSTLAVALLSVRNIAIEFGPAELFDTLLVRPALMYAGPQLVGSLAFGIVIGKVAADVVFYVPVILSYELRRFASTRLPRSTAVAPAIDERE